MPRPKKADRESLAAPMTITVTRAMKKRMSLFKDENWSEDARKAFLARLSELELATGRVPSREEGIARLKAAFEKHTLLAEELGEAWVRGLAEPEQLLQLERSFSEGTDSDWHALANDPEDEELEIPIANRVLGLLDNTFYRSNSTCRYFWEELAPDRDLPLDQLSFAKSFVTAALREWRGMKRDVLPD